MHHIPKLNMNSKIKKLAEIFLEFQNLIFALNWLYGYKDFDLKLDLKYVNSLYADNNNEVKVPSYLLSNIALKNKFNLKGFFLEVGLHVRNLLDEKYYDNIRTNAFGNRFYEPASLRSFILSIKTTF